MNLDRILQFVIIYLTADELIRILSPKHIHHYLFYINEHFHLDHETKCKLNCAITIQQIPKYIRFKLFESKAIQYDICINPFLNNSEKAIILDYLSDSKYNYPKHENVFKHYIDRYYHRTTVPLQQFNELKQCMIDYDKDIYLKPFTIRKEFISTIICYKDNQMVGIVNDYDETLCIAFKLLTINEIDLLQEYFSRQYIQLVVQAEQFNI